MRSKVAAAQPARQTLQAAWKGMQAPQADGQLASRADTMLTDSLHGLADKPSEISTTPAAVRAGRQAASTWKDWSVGLLEPLPEMEVGGWAPAACL